MPKRSFSRLAKIATGKHTGEESEFDQLEHFVHLWVLVWGSFVRNRCLIRASALSYTTLLALIPLLAVAISVTSSILKKTGEEQIYKFVDSFVAHVMPTTAADANPLPIPGTDDLLPYSIEDTNSLFIAPGVPTPSPGPEDQQVSETQQEVDHQIHEFIHNVRSGALGITGMVMLIFVAISMLNRVEGTFNDIWGITTQRPWHLRLAYYWMAISLGPLLIAAAVGLGNGAHFSATRHIMTAMPIVWAVILYFLQLTILWLTFALAYFLIPNTKVRFDAALAGGFIGGTLWHLNNICGFLYVSRIVTNSKIYGSLGLIPVFMVGLYFSWVILLFGAQVAYAYQNRKSYLQDKLVENVNQRGREFIALRLMTYIAQRFHEGKLPPTIQDLSSALGIPTRLVQQVLQPLLVAQLITENSGAEHSYSPSRPLDAINAHHILRAMRCGNGNETMATRDEPARAEVLGEFARIETAERETASQISLLDLVGRAPKQVEDAKPAKETH